MIVPDESKAELEQIIGGALLAVAAGNPAWDGEMLRRITQLVVDDVIKELELGASC